MSDLSLWVALLGGFVVLALAGDSLVRGALALANRLGVSPLVAGIVIVGFGTSAPELFVSLTAALDGSPGIALGNIVGSNIANVWLVMAIPALLVPLATTAPGLRQALGFALLATAGFIAVTLFQPLTLPVGLAFLVVLGLYLIALLKGVPAAGSVETNEAPRASEPQDLRGFHMLSLIFIGTLGLPVGAHLIVEGGVGIARAFNVSEYLIGLTLLAVGTSLPELGAGVAAALRQRADVVVGNVLGSNIFNLLGAGGIIALFGPMEVAQSFANYDYWALGLAILILALFILPRSRVSRLAAVAMLLLYAVYLYGLINGWNLLAAVRGLIG